MNREVALQIHQLHERAMARLDKRHAKRLVTPALQQVVKNAFHETDQVGDVVAKQLEKRAFGTSTLLVLTVDDLTNHLDEGLIRASYVTAPGLEMGRMAAASHNVKLNTKSEYDGILFYIILVNAEDDAIFGVCYFYEHWRKQEIASKQDFIRLLQNQPKGMHMTPEEIRTAADFLWENREYAEEFLGKDKHKIAEHFAEHSRTCAKCRSIGLYYKCCSRCHKVRYCGPECQRAHWPHHKKECQKKK